MKSGHRRDGRSGAAACDNRAVTTSVNDRLAALFAADPRGATAVYVFGSEGRGEARAQSDVDVAVLFDQAPEGKLMGAALTIAGDLERHLGRPVDLVVLNTAPADLVHRVFRDGVVVFDRDRVARIRFEVARRNEYFDLQPIHREYRRTASRQPA